MNKKKSRSEDPRKVKVINLRLTADEYFAINSLCDNAKITRSSYILQAVMNEKVLTNIDAQAIFQLRKIGVNLNQITREVHVISKFVDKKENDLPNILKELSSMNTQIETISNFILRGHAGKN